MTLTDISFRFTEHEMNHDAAMKSKKLSEDVMNLGDIIDIYCPEGREKSLALTKLEECLMWANKSLASEV